MKLKIAQRTEEYFELFARSATNLRTAIEQLKDLASLKQQGVLTEEEFASQKARVLAA